jgi:hypothetical protein
VILSPTNPRRVGVCRPYGMLGCQLDRLSHPIWPPVEKSRFIYLRDELILD